jgi:condensation domain-containing protein
MAGLPQMSEQDAGDRPWWRFRGERLGDDPDVVVPVTDRLPVRFTGAGGGVEPLSWGQLELWTAMLRQLSWMPIGAVHALPPGTTVEDVAAELRFLLSRYETARTRLRFDADGVKQVIADAGEVPLEIVDAEPGDDPDVVAERLWRQYRAADHDFAADWPVRMAVVRHRGLPTHKILVMCHLVTDGAGATQLAAELAGWRQARSGAGEPVPPASPMQAMAQARWQRTAPGRSVDGGARRYWEKLLRTIPPERFHANGSRDPRTPRHWLGEFGSPALLLALRAIAGSLRVATAPVLLSLYAMSLVRLTGISPVVVQVVTDNRFRPGLAGTVSPASQTGLCVLDVAGMTVAEAVATVRRRVMIAFKYAYYDPIRMEDLIARVGRERGEQIDVACYYNDRRQLPEQDSGDVPADAHSTFDWRRREDRSFEHLFVHIDNVPDRIGITVAGDTHRLAPADMEACVRGMERLAVEAAS